MRHLTVICGLLLAVFTIDATPSYQVAAPNCPSSDTLTQHVAHAELDYTAKTLNVSQQITYTNQTDTPLMGLLLNVESNRWQNAFALTSLTVDDVPAAYSLMGRRLDVLLATPLAPACTVTLSLNFMITVPEIIGGRERFRGYFGASPRQINLGHWLPVVVPYRDGEWLYYETILIGEQLVLDPADWYITFTLQNAPPETMIAAPGFLERSADGEWRFTHTNGRDFAASISPVFRRVRLTTSTGIQVDVYTFPDALVPDGGGGWLDGGAFAAQVAVESLDLFAARFGAYQHERLVVVQADFPDGMEFSGFAYVSTDWFTRYTGDPASYLLLITAHEVAHQWWYDQVGSNQALAPWLDEALSTYSELVYIEVYYPNLVDWWWWFRINRLSPTGSVDSTVYEFDQIRPYINAVYLRGVLMFHDMRIVLGDDPFFEWLSAYAVANAGQIATADDLWTLLTPEQFDLTAYTRTVFLRNPGVR